MSQDVFQMHMDQVTDHLPSIIAIHHDSCICSRTPEEHARHLINLMQTTSMNGIVFNTSKSRTRKTEISFYGAVSTSWGMNPDQRPSPSRPSIPQQRIKTSPFGDSSTSCSPSYQVWLTKQCSCESSLPSGIGTPLLPQFSSDSSQGYATPYWRQPSLTMTGPC